MRILEHFGLDGYFTFVAGNTLEETRPTKESVIAYAMEQFPDISRENAVMVGDRKFDIEGAHACGLPSVGVLYGYGCREELTAAGADALAADIEGLGRILRRESL